MRKRRPVSHDDELSVVEHLDELRRRLVSLLLAFSVALAVAFWQNDRVLEIVNDPLPDDTVPATFGVSEAFMSTLTVSVYAALVVTAPILVYHLYAFVLPAFSPSERRVALPLLLLAPLLFAAGAVFGYYVILPAAVKFLLNFNDDQFNIQVRAREYYAFFGMTLLSIGVLFQIPIGVLIANRLGLVTAQQLRKNRRYAILAIAVVAMLLPGTDPVTMLLAMLPLMVLYELSIVLVWMIDRRGSRASEPSTAH